MTFEVKTGDEVICTWSDWQKSEFKPGAILPIKNNAYRVKDFIQLSSPMLGGKPLPDSLYLKLELTDQASYFAACRFKPRPSPDISQLRELLVPGPLKEDLPVDKLNKPFTEPPMKPSVRAAMLRGLGLDRWTR